MIRQMFCIIAVASAPVWAVSTGAPPGSSGAPGDTNCTACHGGSPNTGSGKIRIQAPGGAETYVPGQRIRLSVLLEDSAAMRWGFQLRAMTGSLSAVDADTSVQIQGPEATHSPTGTRRGTRASSTWEVDWTPPADGSAPAEFYVAGNAANNNGQPTGDLIYTSTLTLRTGADSPGPKLSGVVPQAAYGPGVSTTLYLSNLREEASDVRVQWMREDGRAAGDPQSVSLAARGTAVVAGPALEEAAVGWVSLEGRPEVQGYAVLRGDREVAVPMLSAASKRGMVAFEQGESVRTTVALLNPGSEEVKVTITVRDEGGATTSNSELTLKARERVAVELASGRGSVEAVAASGAIVMQAARTVGESTIPLPVVQ